jgi:ketosteroid isomerase-like protein
MNRMLALLGCLCLAPSISIFQDATRNVEEEVRKVQDGMIAAYLHKDVAALDRIYADEYAFIRDDGTVMTKSRTLDGFRSGGRREVLSYRHWDEKVRVNGNLAVITYRCYVNEIFEGTEDSGDFAITRILVRRDNHWQMVGGQETRVSSSQPGSAPSSKDVLTLKQLEQDWLDAYHEGDADKMSKILADDFVGRWGDGSTQTKAEQLKAIRTGAEKHSANQMLECNVRLYGDTAVVTGIQTEQSILEGRDGSGMYSYTDVFVKRDGRWQIVATETKRVASQTGSRENVRDRLIGTWQLVSAGTFRRDGSFEPYPEYGPNARGYLMYDSTGHMCVSLANPNHPHWLNAEKPTDAEKVRSYDVFFAYCGTYEIREKEWRIIHRPEMGSWPHYVGTDQNRNFRLEGNRLILSAEETPPNGEHRRYQITWQRVSPTSYTVQGQ